ncbi:MAG: response regulator [Candidatus Omnitrophica bacterium]|nr:response regulator [Candidatus Omnitrophota bacterium]
MSHKTIFVVEDDIELVQLLRIRLERAGYRVLASGNGDEAFRLIQEKVPDLIMLDIFLPDMDGLTILKRLKAPIDIDTGKPSVTKDIPVIAVTGRAPMIENMTRVEGAVDFFVKPVDMEKVMNRVGELLEFTEHGKRRAS